MTEPTRDRLRELLDAVLDDGNSSLAEMADDAHVSQHHFSRQISHAAGEPPVAMRRRVLLERAAWQLKQGTPIPQAAEAAGYDSIEGFSRAFARAYGHAPSVTPDMQGRDTGHWLPSPNGIHFHTPTALWVDTSAESSTAQSGEFSHHLIHHDLDDTRALLDLAATLPRSELDAVRIPGAQLLAWSGPEETLTAALTELVACKEVWLASIDGEDHPPSAPTGIEDLRARHDAVAPRWLAAIRDIERRGAWDDRLIDALCDPPESFVLGSVVAHILTYSITRRQLVRIMLRQAGVTADDGDPIMWLRERGEGATA